MHVKSQFDCYPNKYRAWGQARSQGGGQGGSSDPPQNDQIQRDRKIIHP